MQKNIIQEVTKHMKICIIAHRAYGALTGEEHGHIGGVERQTALLANWLVKRGHEVSVITWHEHGADLEYVDDIKIIKLCAENAGIPGLRFVTPRWTSLNSALNKADADIYYHNCAEYVTGQIALWCAYAGKRYIYSVASDADCEITLPNLRHNRERLLFRHGLRSADTIVAQTKKQANLLSQNYGLAAKVIPMPGTPPQRTQTLNPQMVFGLKKVIWVGRVQKVKRVWWLIEIAKKMPEVEFEVIGPLDETDPRNQENLAAFEKTPNIKYRGKIKREDMPEIYQNATVLCCTSIYEGFPNTYIEAWSYGVPVVSTIDPDNILVDNDLGAICSHVDGFVETISSLLNSQSRWSTMSANAKRYYEENHELERVQLRFEKEFLNLHQYGVTRRHFESESQIWSEFYQSSQKSMSHIDVQARLMIAAKYIQRMSKTNSKRILDLGSGTGEAASIIPVDRYDLHVADYSQGMVSAAKRSFPNLIATVSDARKLPYAKNTFCTVLSLGLFEYFAETQESLDQIYNTLEPGGILIVSIPNKSAIFRHLRKLESWIFAPLKIALKWNNRRPATDKYFHRQWHLKEFQRHLEASNFHVREVQYCTYGILTPKLTNSELNLKFCRYFNKRRNSKWLDTLLATTAVICAEKPFEN